jgi:hypothetical protein
VRAELFGPSGDALVRLALDTGATNTMINVGHLVAIGHDPALAFSLLPINLCALRLE